MTIEEKYNWNTTYIPVLVEELRILSAKHGMDISVLIGYNQKENIFDVIASGKNRDFSDKALKLSKQLMKIINVVDKEKEFREDRIFHPPLSNGCFRR